MNNRMKWYEIRKTIAVALIVTFLPFSSFAQAGVQVVHAEPMMEEPSVEISQNDMTIESEVTQTEVMEIAESITLEEDWNVSQEIWISTGSIDLNGHTMTVSSNFIHSGGMVIFNGGSLIIEGDYRKQSRMENEDGSYTYGASESLLKMTQAEDYLLVAGDFYDSSSKANLIYLSDGCIELKGDFYQTDETAIGSFCAYGNHTLLISGDSAQKLCFGNDETRYSFATIQNFLIHNISSEGVELSGDFIVRGKTESKEGSVIVGLTRRDGMETDWGNYYSGDLWITNTVTLQENFKLDGDLYFSGYLYIQAELEINGSILRRDDVVYGTYGGDIYMQHGQLVVHGDVLLGPEAGAEHGYAGIILNYEDDYVLIEGDYVIEHNTERRDSKKGVLEVKGDIRWNAPVVLYDGATLRLSGDEKQHISVAAGCKFDILEFQNTGEGICYESCVFYNQLISNGCKIAYFDRNIIGGVNWSQDVVLEGDYVMMTGDMDLNGHTITIKGDLIQINGSININGGKLIVEGSYYLGDPATMWEDEDSSASVGYLNMIGDDDYVLVEKDFYITWGMPAGSPSEYYSNRSKFTAGTLEVKGDFVQKQDDWGGYNSFAASGTHTLLLSGDKKQTVWGRNTDYYGSHIANLKISNTSEEGIEFKGETCVNGNIEVDNSCAVDGYLAVASMEQFCDGYFCGSVTNSTQMTIRNDMKLGGDFKITGPDWGQTPDVTMQSGTLTVGGDFINESDRISFTGGTLEVKGDYTDLQESVYGTGHRVLMSGDTLQTISTKATFGTLELKNYSEEGVYSAEAFEMNELILNGCCLTIGDGSGYYGYTLEEDMVVPGDFTLVAGTLDLNGHTLTVYGDLLLSEGELKINNGTLIVEGDLRIQKRTGTDEGYEYSEGYGHLLMENETDIVRIEGDMILQPGEAIGDDVVDGRIRLLGDLNQIGENGLNYGGVLILNGNKTQTIDSEASMTLNDITVTGGTKEEVVFAIDVTVNGIVQDLKQRTCGEGSIIITDTAQIKDGLYGGNIILNGSSTLAEDFTIGGDLRVLGEWHLDNHMLRVQKLTIDGTLYTDTASVVVEDDLLVQNKGLFVMQDEAYVLVKGNTLFITQKSHNGYLTQGTLEMQGDFTQQGYVQGFWATDSHYTIWRNPENDGSVQNLAVYSNYYAHFNSLEMTADKTLYATSHKPELLAKEVIYVTPGTEFPDPAVSLTVAEKSATSVTLIYEGTWDDAQIRGFRVYRDNVYIGTTTEKVYKDNGLNPETTYVYEVYPYNADNNRAKSSPTCSVTLPKDEEAPEIPKELSVKKRTGSAITLQWNESKDNVDTMGYRLYRDGVCVYEGSDAQYKDNGLSENVVYSYCVSAYDEAGNESELSEAVDGVVFVPQIKSVLPVDYDVIGGESITLKLLLDNSGNAGNFTVRIKYYDPLQEEWFTILGGKVSKKAGGTNDHYVETTWDIHKLTVDCDVDVRFTVTDADGNSIEEVVTYTIDKTAPAIPTNLQAQDDGGTVTINWEISKSADCAGYKLYRVNKATGKGAEIADVTGRNSSWYQDDTVEDETAYNYYIRAYDKFGNVSAMSEVAKVETGKDTKAPRVLYMEPSSGRINETATLTISGKDNRSVVKYELYIRQNSEEEWESLATIDANDDVATYAWDTTDYEEVDHYIKAVAVDGAGNKSEDLFMRRYEVDNTGIAKIRLLPATAGSTTIQLAWEDVTEEDFGYFVVEEKVNGVWAERAKITDKLGYRAENLQPESEHTYRVTGYDNLGNVGIPSDPISVTTAGDTTAPVIAGIEPISSYYKDTIPLAMTVKDNAGVDYGVFSYSVSENGLTGQSFVEIVTVEGNHNTSEKLTHTWDVRELPEGVATVRFEAYDTAGIHNALYEEKQIENTYIIDRTAPDQVQCVMITDNEGAIGLQWNSVSANDVASYEIERATEGESVFRNIGKTTNTLYYTDTAVKDGKTYIYRIRAIDIAGNQGAYSDEIYASVKPDEEAPVVTGISPSEAIVGSNATLKVLAMDNANLSEITIEYRNVDEVDIWHEIKTMEISGRSQYKEITWNTDGLSEETVYEVRAKATDAAGNESEYVTRTYTLDLTAPKAPELSAQSGSFCIELQFSENTEEDFRCYKIYRKEYGEKDYTCVQATIQNEFTDAVPLTDTTYYYQVRAYDIYGNYSESNIVHSYANHVDKIAPVAELPETIFAFTGMEVGFDGTMCNDNVRINRYEWEFGDGEKTTGVRPSHTYEEAGTYNVTLTVRDAAGNEATAYSVVQVMDRTNTGSAVLKVLDENGSGLSGAYVYVKTGNSEADVVRLRTDVNGEAKIICEAGVYEYAAFATGYMPSDSTIRISNYETLEETIRLQKGEVVTGELSVRRMELDELLEKGVDLSAPENYNTFTFTTKLWFASCPLPVEINTTECEDVFPVTRSVDAGKSIGTYTENKSTIQVELVTPSKEMEEELGGSYVGITYLQTTQSVSWLKDMYDVQLGIINNADSGYTITDASATLNLPEGMSLATTKSGQTLNTKLPDMSGQESASASWVVKGDATGKYRLSASFHGVLQPFEADIDAQFEAEADCVVPAGSGIHIYVSPEDAYYPGEDYYIQFKIVNESNRNIYNLSTTLGEYVQSNLLTEVFVKDVNTGTLIRTVRSGGMTYRSSSASKCTQLPVLYDGDIINVGVFSPGETIYATYCQKMGEHKDPDIYFQLTDQLVETVEGENLGVEVSLTPIKSHIYKYISVVGVVHYEEESLDELMGDPVDVTTGAFLQDLTTINLNGGNAINFDLHYNSMLASFEGEAGYGWSHDYEQRIEDRGNTLVLSMDSYTQINFINEEADANLSYGRVENDGTVCLDGETEYTGTYVPTNSGMEGWFIVKNTDGYVVTAPNENSYDFDKEGRLIRMTDINGRSVSIAYDDNTMTIKDDITADTIIVTYDEEGYISKVSDNLGRSVSLTHNGGNLTSITGVDGKKSSFAYNDIHYMISATNPEGLTYVNNTYDEEGRILTQKEAGKAGIMRMSYEDTKEGGVLVRVDDGTGEKIEIESDEKGQKIRVKDVNGAETSYLYDSDGNLLNETDPLGNKVMHQYDEAGNLIKTYDTLGNITFTDYDEKGNPTRVYERDGAGTTFGYDAKNRLVTSIDPLGQTTRFAYDDEGNLIRQVTDGKGVLSYEYENGLLVSQSDADGNKTTFSHDTYGNVVKMTDAQYNETLYDYNEVGELLYQTNPDGTVTAHSYDSLGQKIQTTVTAPDGSTKTERYSYDGAGRMTALTNAIGETTRYSYDHKGNQTAIIYPDGSKDTFVYDNVGNLLKKTTAAGVVTTYTYDLNHNTLSETTGDTTVSYEYYPNGKLYRQILPDGLTYTYTYDSSWNCILVADSQGNSTGYTYDKKGNQTSVRDALGNKTQYVYDNFGRCTQVIDPNGNKTTYSYDKNDNCIRVTDALGNVTEMAYDSLNRMTSTTQYKGGASITVSYVYDSMGRVTSITDEEGVTYHINYDAFGNQVSITDGEGNITGTNDYDALGRVTKTTDAFGGATTYSYDTFGNISKIVDCLNQTTAYTYDADGRIRSVADEAGNTTSQTYDAKGNVESFTDANGGTTTYSYDSMNRVTKLVNAIGATEEYIYNAEGLLSESKDNAGEKTTYKYDAAGRLISQKDDLGTIQYTYDKNGNVLTVSDKDGTIERTYDALNRVTSVTDYNGDTVRYSYDELGNRLSITYPGGEKVRYTYDKAGRMLTVTDAKGKVTYYSYDKNGRLIETKRPDGSREFCTYNVAGQLTVLRDETAAGEVINEYSYEYDASGNIIKITGMDTGMAESTIDVSMTYDADNRLMTYNGQTVEYDKVGNMTRGPLNGAMADFTYDCRNRLVKVKETDGTTTQYEYDAENIRTAVISGGIKTVYTTDRESTYSQTLVKTEYEKNTLGQYKEKISETTYTYGLGLIGERRDNNQEFYYHYNHIGSTMAVTDADGIIYYRYIYDTYGELSGITTDDGVSLKASEQLTEYRLSELAHATGIDYLYNGQYGVETDQNGLYYMRARYYDQDIKRFINRDVVSGDISNSQSLNRYCYVQGNPVSLTDPFGLCPDPNSNFKNFCKVLYYTDWNAVGHAALDIAGVFWEGADVINAAWYLAEGNTEMAISSMLYAMPGFGIGIGNLMMKGAKFAPYGRIVSAVSRMTQSGMGIGAGFNMAQIGFTNMLHSAESGDLNAEDVAMFFGGIAISTLSGKGLVSSSKDLMSCSDDIAKLWKNTKSRVSENFRKFMNDNGGFLDTSALFSRSKIKTLYRGDSITPDIVFKEGFSPKGTHGDALLHHRFNSMPGNYVSTSIDINVSMDYATAEGIQDGYIYIIHTDAYIDMNTVYGKELAHPHDMEFLVKGRIEASQIEGAIRIENNYTMGDFILNPNYRGK